MYGEWGREGPMVMGPSYRAVLVWRGAPRAPGFLATSGLKGSRMVKSGPRQELAASLKRLGPGGRGDWQLALPASSPFFPPRTVRADPHPTLVLGL